MTAHSPHRTAFTLSELLIAVVVVAVLAAVAVPVLSLRQLQSREHALKATLREVRIALERHRNDTGGYPRRLSLLNDQPFELADPMSILSKNGTPLSVSRRLYKGPYLDEFHLSHRANVTQDNPIGGSFSPSSTARVPIDPVSNKPLRYRFTGGQFVVSSSAKGNDSQGVPYSQY